MAIEMKAPGLQGSTVIFLRKWALVPACLSESMLLLWFFSSFEDSLLPYQFSKSFENMLTFHPPFVFRRRLVQVSVQLLEMQDSTDVSIFFLPWLEISQFYPPSPAIFLGLLRWILYPAHLSKVMSQRVLFFALSILLKPLAISSRLVSPRLCSVRTSQSWGLQILVLKSLLYLALPMTSEVQCVQSWFNNTPPILFYFFVWVNDTNFQLVS